MKISVDLPAVITRSMDGGVEAIVALALRSVASAELVSTSNDNGTPNNQALLINQWQSRQQLMQALAIWPDHTAIELHWTAHPDLKQPVQGQLWISIILRTIADDRDAAIQGAIQGYLRLRPLLETHLPFVTFSSISQKSELRCRLHPFDARYAMAIGRLRRRVALSNPLPRTSVGFGPILEPAEKGDCVDLCFPWSPARMTSNQLAKAMMALWDPIQLVVRLTPYRPNRDEFRQFENQIADCERFLTAGSGDQVASARQVSMIRDMALLQLARINEAAFRVCAFLFSSTPIDEALAGGLTQLMLASTTGKEGNHLFVGGHTVFPIDVADTINPFFLGEVPVSCQEASAIFALPLPVIGESSGLYVRRWRTAAITSVFGNTASKKSIVLFDNFHNERLQPVSLTNDDRMKHMFVVGATGTGKSVFLTNMILQDISKGNGVFVMDPHGDMVESILPRIPRRRAADVILFDVLDERPVGFNLLQWDTIEERDMIIDEMYQAIDLMYDMKVAGGPIFENHFRKMLKLLCGDGNGQRQNFFPTVLEFERCYLEKDMRRWLSERTSEKDVKDFIKEIERSNTGEIQLCNVAQYITSKFGRFTADQNLRRIFGQDTTSFSFDDILQQGKIFLVKMGRGRCGTAVSSLLASQLVARFKIAAMRRGSIPEKERKDFFMYIDEAGLIPPASIGDLLSEARKYRLGVVLSTQYTKQLSSQLSSTRKDTLLDSVIGNVGAIVAFRLGREDAKEMAINFWPDFSTIDIVRLPNFHGYAKIQNGSQPSSPFSLRTRPLSARGRAIVAEEIRKVSSVWHGNDPEEVDAQIQNRRKPWLYEEKENETPEI
ncbi:uncharacterized protein Dvar_51540 [Desulfosarcina variabilis str. Montpellier]|uniref:type IV secretory system conjugative DNA transfer family protein n=1 Tax=Desulfosarcina variabilis TaxID=2300 RepID=UPI003AFAF773